MPGISSKGLAWSQPSGLAFSSTSVFLKLFTLAVLTVELFLKRIRGEILFEHNIVDFMVAIFELSSVNNDDMSVIYRGRICFRVPIT